MVLEISFSGVPLAKFNNPFSMDSCDNTGDLALPWSMIILYQFIFLLSKFPLTAHPSKDCMYSPQVQKGHAILIITSFNSLPGTVEAVSVCVATRKPWPHNCSSSLPETTYTAAILRAHKWCCTTRYEIDVWEAVRSNTFVLARVRLDEMWTHP